MMTLQEIFNIAYLGILNQGGFSANNGTCVYRAPDGRKCAAGWLIPDSEYRPSMEGFNARQLGYFWDRYPSNFITFIERMQQTHDRFSHSDDIKGFQKRMAELAKEYNLTIPENNNEQ